MQAIYGASDAPPFSNQCVLTIGNFDGVHLGHRALLAKLKEASLNFNVPSVVYTFDPHPMTVLQPSKPFFRLFETKDQEEQLADLGVDFFVIEKFTKKFSSIDPAVFLKEQLFDKFNPRHIVVGFDFAFGENKKGTISELQEFAEKNNCTVDVVDPVSSENQIISSSLIRKHIVSGGIEKANALLQRAYYLQGDVEIGDQRGRTLGFPTANMTVDDNLHPHSGVYVSRMRMEGQEWASVSNIGTRPTFKSEDQVQCFLETHVFNFNQEIYGRNVRVELLKFLRNEKKFSGVEQLTQQIALDCETAKEVHDEMGGHWK